MQVCASTACFGFVSEITHEQFFTAACIILRAVMGELDIQPYPSLESVATPAAAVSLAIFLGGPVSHAQTSASGALRTWGNGMLPYDFHCMQGWGVLLWTLPPWLSLPPCTEAHLFWELRWAFRYLRHTDRSPLQTIAGWWLLSFSGDAWEV